MGSCPLFSLWLYFSDIELWTRAFVSTYADDTTVSLAGDDVQELRVHSNMQPCSRHRGNRIIFLGALGAFLKKKSSKNFLGSKKNLGSFSKKKVVKKFFGGTKKFWGAFLKKPSSNFFGHRPPPQVASSPYAYVAKFKRKIKLFCDRLPMWCERLLIVIILF